MLEKNNDVLAPVEGMKAAVKALAELSPDHAMYRSEDVSSNPIVDSYGEYTKKRELVQGRTTLLDELNQSRVVMFSLLDAEGTKKVVRISKTPKDFLPDQGGKFVIGAGKDRVGPQKYWMDVHKGREDVPPVPFYLSEEELNGISIAVGDVGVEFKPFMESETEARRVQITGTIEKVVTLE